MMVRPEDGGRQWRRRLYVLTRHPTLYLWRCRRCSWAAATLVSTATAAPTWPPPTWCRWPTSSIMTTTPTRLARVLQGELQKGGAGGGGGPRGQRGPRGGGGGGGGESRKGEGSEGKVMCSAFAAHSLLILPLCPP